MPDLPVTYPVGTVGVSGTSTTLDFLLKDPNRVTNVLARIMLQRFYVDQIFAPAGEVVGGATIFSQTTANELYADRDVQRVEPGQEFPELTFSRGVVRTAQVEKFGGKFDVTDEAVRRNRQGPVNQALGKLGNTIQRKIQQRALAELTAAVAEHGRTAVGTSWSGAAGTITANRTATVGPLADLTSVELANENIELGYSYNLAIMNPVDWRNFRLAAGGEVSGAMALLQDSGIDTVWPTKRQPVGTVKWLAKRQVGEIGFEVPLTTEVWRDQNGKQKNWYQASILPIVYVTDPFAILETTGH